MKKLVSLCCCLFLLACENSSNKNQAMDAYVQKEIGDRIGRINAINKQKDTLLIDPQMVEKKINDLILMSKDIENLQASVNLANLYLDTIEKKYHVVPSHLKRVNTGMHVNDIASALKEDEMVLFNHLLLQTGQEQAVPLHAAQ